MKKVAIFCLTLSLLGSLPAFAQAPNPVAEQNWQTYLSNHPGLAENPQLLNNQTYLNEHPQLSKWLQQHPAVAQQAREQGMWDHNGAWHNSSWWHEHNPNLLYQNHPGWVANHPEWAQNHPAVVRQQHPGWVAREYERHEHREAEHRNY
jgi:hypothetical protein